MKISIIIPVWNGRNLLEKNLPKVILAAKNPRNNIGEIILVDDASPDDSVEFIKKNYKNQVRLVRLKNNRGFSGAINMGVYASRNPLICLLNMDVIPAIDFLETMQDRFADKKVFAVTLKEDKYGPAIGSFKKGFFQHKPGPIKKIVQESMWASGGSAVFRRSLWIKLKGFDEEIYTPFYWEDVDLGYRAWKRGYQILWDPKAIVQHKHESVINPDFFAKNYLNSIKQRNYLLFQWKNITSPALWTKHKKYLLRYALTHPGYFRIIFMAWKKSDLIKRRREKEMRNCRMSDEAIFERFNK